VPTHEPADDVSASELPEGSSLVVFRLVTTDKTDDPALRDCFRSNAEQGKPPRGREKRQPSLHRGLSVCASREQAIDRQKRIVAALRLAPGEVPRIGAYVATLELRGPDVWHTEPEVDGHLTIWASPSTCTAAVTDIEAIR
jgi:hypothetical protein